MISRDSHSIVTATEGGLMVGCLDIISAIQFVIFKRYFPICVFMRWYSSTKELTMELF